jgi:hypothetical protein
MAARGRWDTVFMRLAVTRDPGIASLPRRAASISINAVLMGGGMLGVVGVVAATECWREAEHPAWMRRIETSDLGSHPALTGALWSTELTARNWRTPGMRATGIRRADARTRGAVSFRSASVTLLARLGSERIGRALGQPTVARARSRRLAADDEIERMRASRPDADPAELMHDAVEIRRRLGASSCTWMLPRILTRVAIEHLPMLVTARRQTLTQWLTGTVVVLDR